MKRVIWWLVIFLLIVLNLPGPSHIDAQVLGEPLYIWERKNDLPIGLGTYYGAAYDNQHGRVYVVGGYTSSTAHVGTNHTYMGVVNNHNITWTQQPNYPKSVLGNATFTNGLRVYVFGGDDGNGNIVRDAYVANIRPDGTLEPWQTYPALPVPLHFHAIANHNNRILIVGGRTIGDQPSRAIYRRFGGTWDLVSNLPKAVSSPAVTIYNGYIYVGGGSLQSAGSTNCQLGEVYYAPISEDGSIGVWRQTTTYPAVVNFWPSQRISPGIRSFHHMVGFMGNMYAFPATSYTLHTACNPYYNPSQYATSTLRTLRAPINSDGSLGAWEEVGAKGYEFDRRNFVLNDFPSNAYGFFNAGNAVFTIGGMNYAGVTNAVYFMDLTLHVDPCIPCLNRSD